MDTNQSTEGQDEREQPRSLGVKFEGRCFSAREEIKSIGDGVRYLLKHPIFDGDQKYPDQHAEMKANITLVYRHLEDARMRVGKILQAAGDGVSILDK